MRALITLSLVCCLVLAMSTPVSADYYAYKDVNATDLTNALVDYCNGNTVHNMSGYECELSGHNFKIYNATGSDFDFECCGSYVAFGFFLLIPLPIPESYKFTGHMHVDNPQEGLKKPYTLDITDYDERFTADGKNWKLQVWNTDRTRFKV